MTIPFGRKYPQNLKENPRSVKQPSPANNTDKSFATIY